MNNNNCIVVLGPTASGKTKFACNLTFHLNGEIISADSRQVYKHLNIGTGKDLEEYTVKGTKIPYHLIDVCEPDEQFFLHDFVKLLHKSFTDIQSRNKLPIICGGTGLYLDALHTDYSFTQVPENYDLRDKLSQLSKAELIEILKQYPSAENRKQEVDLNSVKRIIRGIEIAEYFKTHKDIQKTELPYKPIYFGIKVSKEERNKRIDERLKQRLQNGLIEEVEGLLKKGITHQRLEFLGLEYKFISYYLQKLITKEELFIQLSTAIHQYAKRQMTWYRRMEKNGIEIKWVNANEVNEVATSILKTSN